MYLDHSNTQREQWTYKYTGTELLPYARRKYDEFLAREKAARAEVASLSTDMQVSTQDDRVAKARKDADKFGAIREALQVYIHVFSRDLGRDFELGLGDVTFFDLAPMPKETKEQAPK